jgi:iron complex transport system ATP-binding protein
MVEMNTQSLYPVQEGSTEDAILKISALKVAYGERIALDGVSLELRKGEVLGLIGPNGAGKSTLIKALSGVLPVQSGRVACLGRDLLTLPPVERARTLAVVPQARPEAP